MFKKSMSIMAVAITMCLSALLAVPAAASGYANSNLIVAADALQKELLKQQDALVVIDVRPIAEFKSGHISGARQLDPDAVADPKSSIDGALLPISAIAQILGSRGISADANIVLYDDKSGFHAARIFWLLEYHGLRNVRILDGGLKAWKKAGFSLKKGSARPMVESRYTAAVTSRRHASADWIMQRKDDRETVVIDVRPKSAFDKGHIPWARSIPWKGNLAPDGTMKSGDELRTHFAAHGVTDAHNVVVHCQNGLASSHSYFALRLIGHPRVRTYHRSWSEWGQADDLPKAVTDDS
ncbi:MAG: sulfurtransferase [Pseudomonadota bacterium]